MVQRELLQWKQNIGNRGYTFIYTYKGILDIIRINQNKIFKIHKKDECI